MQNELQKLKLKLEKLLQRKIDLHLKENRTVFFKLKKGFFKSRMILHKSFLKAGDEEFFALKEYIANRSPLAKKKLKTFFLKQFSQENNQYLKRSLVLRTQGSYYDLKQIFEEVCLKYFGRILDLKITWGKKNFYPKGARITFGSYNHLLKLIRINPLLDNSQVPFYFICFVVYHEILHDIYPERFIKERRYVHFHEFKIAEKQFLEYKKAKVFKQQFRKGI